MAFREVSPERLQFFSDGVFAVLITVLVLELHAPSQGQWHSLIELWPEAASYAVSYLFIAIIWVNHHHLVRFTHEATSRLIWWNFAHLFMISLVPAATAWMASSRLAAAPVFVYALVFVLIEVAYIAFERTAFLQARETEIAPQTRRTAAVRSYVALGMFSTAAVISFWSPRGGLGLVCCVLLIYLNPRLPDWLHRWAR